MMRRYGMMRGMCQRRAMLLGPCVGRLGLQQPHQRQTQRHTPKQSNDDPHLNGEHINKVLLAKTLVAVAHPVDERDLGAFRASRSHRTQEHRRLRKRHTFTRVACLMAILLACCARSGPDQLGLSPVAFRDLPGWQADRVAEAMPALLKSCQHADTLSTGQSRGTVAAPGVDLAVFWPRVCTAARSVPADDEPAMRAFVERQFQPYAVSNNGHTDGVLTGYFEPEVEGARNANARMHAPLLARPTDLVEVDLGAFSADLAGRRIAGRMQDGSLVPYWDRAEIEAGALGNRAQPIVYLARPIQESLEGHAV
jgi:hypothetical protein